MHVLERWRVINYDLLRLDMEVTGTPALQAPYRRMQRYKRRANGTMNEQLCVASKNRDTSGGLNLAPPPPQQRPR